MSDNLILLSITSAIFIIILSNLISSDLTIKIDKKLNNKWILLIILLFIIYISYNEINIALIILITFILCFSIIKLRIAQMQSSTPKNSHKINHPHKNISHTNNIKPLNNENILQSDYITQLNEYDNLLHNNNITHNIKLIEHNTPLYDYNKPQNNIESTEHNTSLINILSNENIPHASNNTHKQIIDKQEICENIKLKTLDILKMHPETNLNIIINTFKDIYPDNETIITNAVNESYYNYNNSDNNQYEYIKNNNENNINDIYDIKKLANNYYTQKSDYKEYVSKKSIKDILTEADTFNAVENDNNTDIYNNINNFNQDDNILYSNNFKNNEHHIYNNSVLFEGYDKNNNFELEI